MKKFLPPTHFFTYLIISVLLHFFLPVAQIIELPFNWLGFVFFFFGGILNIWTDQLFKKNKTTVKPDEKPALLIQTGPFKFSRNPMYLGMALLLFGAGIILGSVMSFAGFIIFVLAMEFSFIPQEEKILAEQFGQDFESYKRKVRRWI
jgi:protein-S-isoprenylcysteine O-methyltransferase Ste14